MTFKTELHVGALQGRRQEFFQGRALGGSRGGLPSHFSISRGAAQPRFLVASMVKMKKFSGQGACPACLCLPTPLVISTIGARKRVPPGTVASTPSQIQKKLTSYILCSCQIGAKTFSHAFGSRIKCT